MGRLYCLLLFYAINPGIYGAETHSESKFKTFATILIESFPKGKGYAMKSVGSDGEIRGGHISGSVISDEQSVVSDKDVQRLNELAQIVSAIDIKENIKPDRKVTGYLAVTITYTDKTSITFYKLWDDKFFSKEFEEIWAIIHDYKVGSW